MKKIIVAAAAALLAAGAAQAQTTTGGFYGDVGYTFVKVKDDQVSASFKPGAIRGIVGWDLHPYVALEAMLAGGAGDDSKLGATVKVSRSYGLYVKPKFAINDQFEVFGRLGFADSKIKVSGPIATATGKDSSFSWGVGAAYNFNKQVYGAVDYMSYYDKDTTKIDGVTLSVGYRF